MKKWLICTLVGAFTMTIAFLCTQLIVAFIAFVFMVYSMVQTALNW